MSRPVLYLPGLPASHLEELESRKRIFLSLNFGNPLLEGPDDLTRAEPIRATVPVRHAMKLLIWDLAKQAGSLYDLLRRLKITPVKIGWDWRRPVWDSQFSDPDGPYSVAHRLRKAIQKARRDGGKKSVVIVHSTGGLVLRHLLESEPSLADDIDRVIAFGVPWAGTPKAMEIVNAQEGFAGIVSPARAQEIMTKSWAGWDLFPPRPDHLFDDQGRPLMLTYRELSSAARQATSALTDRDWIASLPTHLQASARLRAAAADGELLERRPRIDLGGRSLRITNVVGWGRETPICAVLSGKGSSATMKVHRGTQDATLEGGDGTVPTRSAAWLRGSDTVEVATYFAPIGRLPSTRTFPHSRLWSNPVGIDLLRHLLGNASLGNLVYAALDGNDTAETSQSATVRARAVALDPAGAPLPDARIRTRDLIGGRQLQESFDPQHRGRHLLAVPRSRIRKVGQQKKLRRLEIEIGWSENGHDRWQPRSFLFPV